MSNPGSVEIECVRRPECDPARKRVFASSSVADDDIDRARLVNIRPEMDGLGIFHPDLLGRIAAEPNPSSSLEAGTADDSPPIAVRGEPVRVDRADPWLCPRWRRRGWRRSRRRCGQCLNRLAAAASGDSIGECKEHNDSPYAIAH